MKKNEIVLNIEKELTFLLERLTEKEYVNILKEYECLSIYDDIASKYSSYIFDNKFLKYIHETLHMINEINN